MADSGISGLAVAAAGVGAFLVYAGIKDVPTISGLREIIRGKTPTGRPQKSRSSGDLGTVRIRPWTKPDSAIPGIPNSIANPLIVEARKHLGKKYVFGAVGPNTFDCSGLVVYCLRQTYDKNTPRLVTHTFAAWLRSRGWVKVDETRIQTGDIVLKSGHMGIAISNTEMIHAPRTGDVVKISKIYSPRYMWSGWRKP